MRASDKNFSINVLYIIIVICFLIISSAFTQDAGEISHPENFFGFMPGADHKLFNYDPLIEYLKQCDKASDRLRMIPIGESPQGKTMYLAFFSSEENIANLDQLKAINRSLALDPELDEAERNEMIADGKVFVLGTLSMHASEVGPAQAAPLVAYQLLTEDTPELMQIMNDVVYMMVPSHNPDGMDMIVNHYNKYLGTKYEASSLPGVYHEYVGHDNNRDFITLTQEDNLAVARIYNKDWFPQVMVEKHQMGWRGPRYFVPPMHDPIAENIDAEIWNWTWVFGSNMVKDMTRKGLAGISQHYLFDDYWPGSTETCLWKNVIGLLTEAASCKTATPVYVEPNELAVFGKGLAEYKKSINMSLPWEGGWWRLADIVEYEIESTYSILKTSSLHRKEILRFRNDICRSEVQKGKTQAPYYYILPFNQHDKSELVLLVSLLREHGVQVYQLTEAVTVAGRTYGTGDIVVPLAQPFRPFIKEVMEKQEFPERHYTPGGELIKPYDITSWSLPLHRGLSCAEIKQPIEKIDMITREIDKDFILRKQVPPEFWAAAFTANHNESFKAAFLALENNLTVERLKTITDFEGNEVPDGSFVIYNADKRVEIFKDFLKKLNVKPLFVKNKLHIETESVSMPRIALVETYFHDMDAGWTRYIFDEYHIPFTIVRPGEFEKTDFSKKYDIVIFPDADKSLLMEGKYKSDDDYYISSYPPDYTKGIGKEGMQRLMSFLDKGGKIIAWGRSTGLFTETLEIKHSKKDVEQFQLPVNDIAEKLQKEGLYCPGSFMKIELKKHHPLTFGMKPTTGIFYRGRPVFTTTLPRFDMDRRVIGKFPEKNILMSGYCQNEKKLADKTALVWLKKGRGQVVLFAFSPQFRSSTHATYKLLFNALLLDE